MRKIIAIICAVTVIALSACSGTGGEPSQQTTAPQNTQSVPSGESSGAIKGDFGSFTATDLKGNEVTQEVFKGKKLTMINIWATFCGPCIDEMPDLGKLNTTYADRGFQIIGRVSDAVGYNGAADTSILSQAAEIIGQTNADYMHLIPSDDLQTIILSEVTAVPTTVFVDENGKVVGDDYIGSRSLAEWQGVINKLLESA